MLCFYSASTALHMCLTNDQWLTNEKSGARPHRAEMRVVIARSPELATNETSELGAEGVLSTTPFCGGMCRHYAPLRRRARCEHRVTALARPTQPTAEAGVCDGISFFHVHAAACRIAWTPTKTGQCWSTPTARVLLCPGVPGVRVAFFVPHPR